MTWPWEWLVIQVLPAPPTTGRGELASPAWTSAARSGSSWPPGAPASPLSRPACPPTVLTGVSPACGREEVALLAGVSVDYYTQMERGNLGGVSGSILDALAG